MYISRAREMLEHNYAAELVKITRILGDKIAKANDNEKPKLQAALAGLNDVE
jgi:hypothetical protein